MMLPVIFSFGPITIYSFGFFLGIGFFLSAFMIWRRLKDLGLEEERIIDFVLVGALAGVLVSKSFFFLEKQTLSGWSFPGALMGISLGWVWFARKQKWDFWQIADEVVFGILPWVVLIQVGAFLDGSQPGRSTNMPWGMYFPGSLVRSQPVSLFSALAFFGIWLVLLIIERHWRIWKWYKSKNRGFLALAFLILSAAANSVIAFWEQSALYWYWLEIVASGLLSLTGMIVLYCRSGRNWQDDLSFLFRKGRLDAPKIKKEKRNQL